MQCALFVQLLAILGEQFIVGDELCGAVVSVRPNEDIISLWNKTASNPDITTRIRCLAITPIHPTCVRPSLTSCV